MNNYQNAYFLMRHVLSAIALILLLHDLVTFTEEILNGKVHFSNSEFLFPLSLESSVTFDLVFQFLTVSRSFLDDANTGYLEPAKTHGNGLHTSRIRTK